MVSYFKEFNVTLQFIGLKIVSKSSRAQDHFRAPSTFFSMRLVAILPHKFASY